MSDHSDHILEAATFAENVRRELRSFPAEKVAELTDGLEADIAMSLADGGVLPDAGNYAADLLRGAGLKPMSDQSLRNFAQRVSEPFLPAWNKVRHHTRGLAPAWWILRAWVATQVIGYTVSETDSARPILNQWNEMPIAGGILFATLVFLSVQIGRNPQKKWKKVVAVANLLLVPASLGVLFTEPTRVTWVSYGPATDGCPIASVPNVVSADTSTARAVMLDAGFRPIFIDAKTSDIVSEPFDVEVISQSFPPGVRVCQGDQIELTIDTFAKSTTSTIEPSAIPDGSDPEAPTTVPKTTTSVPKSTTTKPKTTTTTTP